LPTQNKRVTADRAAAREGRRIETQVCAVGSSTRGMKKDPLTASRLASSASLFGGMAAPAATLEVLRMPWEDAGIASTCRVHFSGEPFGGRDIQFQNPEIGIGFPAPLKERIKILFVFNSLPGSLPGIAAVRPEQALEKARFSALFGQNHRDRAGSWI